jgi:hypothetical protein
VDLFSDHNLLFFDFNLFVKLSSSDTRTVLDYRLADWPGLYRTLLSINLSPLIALDQINNMSSNSNPGDINKDWECWCDRFKDAVHRHIPTKIIKNCLINLFHKIIMPIQHPPLYTFRDPISDISISSLPPPQSLFRANLRAPARNAPYKRQPRTQAITFAP